MRKRPKLNAITVISGCLCVAFQVVVVRAEELRLAAIVTNYKGRPAEFSLLRSGQKLAVKTYLQLYDGDEVTVLSPTGEIELRFTDGSNATVKKAQGSVKVTARGAPVSMSDKVRDFLSKIGLRIDRDKTLPLGSPTGTRGPATSPSPLALRNPGLTSGNAKVLGGSRRLALAWTGGTPPFRVFIGPKGGAEIVDASLDSAWQVSTIEPRALKPGPYAVSVVDHGGAKAEGAFTVVEVSASDAKRANDLAWLDDGGRAIVAACELLKSGKDVWGYEAYLSLINAGQTSDRAAAQAVLEGACE